MNTERVWLTRKLYEFADGRQWTRPVGRDAADHMLAFAFGRSSDGRNFAVSITAKPEELADGRHLTSLLDEKFRLLDTFLDPRCECVPGPSNKPCAFHRKT